MGNQGNIWQPIWSKQNQNKVADLGKQNRNKEDSPILVNHYRRDDDEEDDDDDNQDDKMIRYQVIKGANLIFKLPLNTDDNDNNYQQFING